MKKSIIILVTIMFPMIASAFSKTIEYFGIWYTIDTDANTATVAETEGKNYIGDIIIPSSIVYQGTTFPVVGIGSWAFASSWDITSVTMPSSIRTIGSNSFYGCIGITEMTIPSSVTEICGNPFSSCWNLVSVNVDSNNTVYDSRNDCNAIIETAPNKLISGCMTTVIPDGIECIGERAFESHSGLVSINIPHSVMKIERSAFSLTGLLSINIPSSVASIEEYAFSCCYDLSDIVWPENITSIEEATFYSCKSLKSIIISDNVTKIGERAFDACTNLGVITIGKGVNSIGRNAFYDCINLTAVHISDLESWCKIDFDDNPLFWANHLFLNGEEIKDLVIPENITAIKKSSFLSCYGLGTVTMHDNVTSIDESAFRNCGYLNSVHLSKNLETISYYAFMNCRFLQSVDLPNCLDSIKSMAFQGCSELKEVKIGSRIKYIANAAFGDCLSLIHVHCYAKEVPETGIEAFRNVNVQNVTLHVPDVSLDLYKSSAPWELFNELVAIDDNPLGINCTSYHSSKREKFYNLRGQRIVESPMNGLYISNGKKVVINRK